MKRLIIVLIITAFSCKKQEVLTFPDCDKSNTGSVQVDNNSREDYLVSIHSVTAEVDAGGFLLVNDVPSGEQKVSMISLKDGGGGTVSTFVAVCDTVRLEIK